jgi:hypothetical protein
MNRICNMAYSSSLGTSSNSINECNICYETCSDDAILKLSCCNGSKKICVNCVSCLTTPICPYCRNKLDDKCLPYLKEHARVSHSYPEDNFTSSGFSQFIEEEGIINPYLYDNSRRLRRQIRRLRHEYNQRRTGSNTINITQSHERTRTRSSRAYINQHNRNVRHYYQQETRRMQNLYNDINRYQGLSSEILNDEMLFHIEDI